MSEDTELREYARYAVFRKGTSNKFYQVRVEELEDGQANLFFSYGRLGTAGKTLDQGRHYCYESAVCTADEQFAKKLNKGYREERSSLVLLAMTIEEPEERKGHGLPAVEVEFVMPDVSTKMEVRLGKFARKFLSKLNLVRKDRFSLTEKQYEKQVEDLGKQFAAEFNRISNSKGYGAEADQDVKQAIVYYYRALRENLGVVPDLGRGFSSYHWPMRNFSFNTGIYE